ncbi:hypothetical protein M422DRAFT_246789 [Sphaerobolus stellatus SS14]|nr:hypothetical protein M422DRAFT_246789 [Sphaerobolus stellatus SS14]
MSPTETEVKEDPSPPSKEDTHVDPSFTVEFSRSPLGEINKVISEVGDISFLWSSVLGPRILLENTPLGFRRNVMLAEGLKKLTWSHRPPYYPLPKHGERLADRLLKIVKGVLIGIPPRRNTGEPCYYVHPESWINYLQEMKRILSASFPLLLEKDETIPSMPRWGPNNNPKEAWIRLDFEIIGVIFREDVENILGYLFNKEVLGLIPRAVDRVTFAPEIMSTPQAFIYQTPHHMSIHPTPNVEDRIDSTRGLIHQHFAQTIDTGIKSQTEGLGEIRKQQSESIYAPRSFVIPPVYGKHPMELAQSNRLKEFFSPYQGPKGSSVPANDPHTPTPVLCVSDKKSSLGIFANTRKEEALEGSSVSNTGFPPGSPSGGPRDDPPPGGGPPSGGNSPEPHFNVKLKSDAIPNWVWGPKEQHAWNLAKKALASAPIRAYTITGLGDRLYTNTCNSAIAAILQQIQAMKIRDLRGTRLYEHLKKAWEAGLPIPSTVSPFCVKEAAMLTSNGSWDEEFEETVIQVERVIVYWSRVLKEAERNYTPTEKEAPNQISTLPRGRKNLGHY